MELAAAQAVQNMGNLGKWRTHVRRTTAGSLKPRRNLGGPASWERSASGERSGMWHGRIVGKPLQTAGREAALTYVAGVASALPASAGSTPPAGAATIAGGTSGPQ